MVAIEFQAHKVSILESFLLETRVPNTENASLFRLFSQCSPSELQHKINFPTLKQAIVYLLLYFIDFRDRDYIEWISMGRLFGVHGFSEKNSI